jgi:hypothetical protein
MRVDEWLGTCGLARPFSIQGSHSETFSNLRYRKKSSVSKLVHNIAKCSYSFYLLPFLLNLAENFIEVEMEYLRTSTSKK